jgi:hypothetical protein
MVGRSLCAWFAWLPVIILWAFLIFVIPFLGLIVAAVIAVSAVAALGALVWRIVAALDGFVRFVLRRRRDSGGAARRNGAVPAISAYREHAQHELTAHARTAMMLDHQRP